ncbi:membrane-spanning 4-domains subfamily A member 13 [Equus quagga]|uniref:membrane-spanning 4-domains subfamily A member 13 n=1 Tax=Equus quagga TaxID=89248 RepID=UPI001EE3939D|nr:membrane-spanning 4-domains subfamily A member 13 [Equus quagga]
MAGCRCPKLSTADGLVLGAMQIMLGIFHVFMWYFLFVLYMGQIKGVFGKYEPITYKTGCSLWGIIFIISGVSIIRATKYPNQRLITCALVTSILCIVTAIAATVITIMELVNFESVSYRNYGQAKLGREVSAILLSTYPLEVSIALAYSIFGCIGLSRGNEDTLSTVTIEEAESPL